MSNGKTHLAGYDAPNESDSFGYWGETTCGSESENVTQYENEVTCKNCLRIINKCKTMAHSNEPTIEAMDKAIAEFMELETDNEPHLAHRRTVYLVNGYWWPLRKLKYHTSWSWLMPVWFKIQTIGADMGYSFKKFHEAFHAGIDHRSIEKCHKAVHQFITWLNQKKETNEQ